MEYYFNIAGLRLACEVPFQLTIGAESKPFCTESGKCDLYADFAPEDTLPPIPQNAIGVNGRVYYESEIWHRFAHRSAPYAWVRWEGKKAICRYLPGWEREMNSSRCVLDLLGLENILINQNGLLLHCAFIRWQDWGILFSAPSGTGKSTQADLWERWQNSETLNGDRAALKIQDRRWTAFGLPFAGSSCIYRNESAPVAAIVTLSKGSENEISRLSPMEAVRRLLPEVTIHRWDPVFVQHAADLLVQLVQQIPVYHLRCRPDEGAVQLLHDTITKEVPL